LRVSVHTVRFPHFSLDVNLQDEIKGIKLQIINHLQNNLKAYIPPQHHLIYQGNMMSDTKKLSDLHPENDDHFFFIYDLNAKPPPQPVIAAGSTQTLIDSLVSSWSQVQNNTPVYPVNPPSQNPQDQQRATMLKIIESDDFFPDQESLGLLMSMGFSMSRAKKALVINYFEPSAAAEWLLAHSFDPDIDDPLTVAQVNQILNRDPTPHRVTPPPQVPQQSLETLMQNAIKNRNCTYTVTKTKHANQNWYHCFTCGFVDSEGVCESCMNVCHEGHVISEVKTGSFYCDCGHNKANSNCQCCNS